MARAGTIHIGRTDHGVVVFAVGGGMFFPRFGVGNVVGFFGGVRVGGFGGGG